MTLSRITITIPEDLVDEADRKAATLDRSRSWVLVEALRRYLAPATGEVRDAVAVREPIAEYLVGLGPSRQAQLEADLRLTPEERVREAERTLQVDEARRGPAGMDRILTFDRYEDYLQWTRHEVVRR